jgi:phosphohistidine phosphatase
MTGTPRRLYLLRHAKSSWDAVGVPDRDRPLAPRGKRAAAALRQHFADIELQVDLVLCSPARRTRETWAGVAGGLAGEPRTEFVEQIYGAETADLLNVVREVDPDVGSLLLIGHSPGFGDLAHDLAGDGDPAAVARLGEGYPTAAFATLSVDVPWSDVRRGSGRLLDFVRPRDLGAH